jgi:hypothetical protein
VRRPRPLRSRPAAGTKRTDHAPKARLRLDLLLAGVVVLAADAKVVAVGQQELLEVEAVEREAARLVREQLRGHVRGLGHRLERGRRHRHRRAGVRGRAGSCACARAATKQ